MVAKVKLIVQNRGISLNCTICILKSEKENNYMLDLQVLVRYCLRRTKKIGYIPDILAARKERRKLSGNVWDYAKCKKNKGEGL